jgi:signal transduction histidine kinase
VAIALENARLYSEVRDRLALVSGLQAAGTALAEELHPERALRVVAEQALSLSGAGRVSIELARPIGRELQVQVAVGEDRAAPADNELGGSRLVLPLRARGRALGILSAESQHPNAFSSRQLELLATFAGQAAISLDNAQLYAELQSRLEEMVGLQRLGTLLLEEHDFDRVLVSICRQLQRLTDAGGVGLALLEDDPRFLEMRTVVGPSADVMRGARIPTEGSFAAEALRTNRPQRSDDAQNDPRGYKQSLTLGNTRTILSVAMKTRQRTIGVLSIYNKEGDDGFTDRDAELATFFANQAAAAIENARLYEQTREYAVVEERNRLARELHDSVTQSLFSVTLLSEAALNLLDRDPARARERLERANELAQGALAEMRALIFQLRPLTLQEEGLLSALKKHLAALHSRHDRTVELQVTGTARRLPAAIEDAAFRILQEGLNNVIKHANAPRVQIQLDFDADCLRMSTFDTGVGFDPTARREGQTLGMSSMLERAEAVGGRLTVESAPGRGTRVSAELPLEHAG